VVPAADGEDDERGDPVRQQRGDAVGPGVVSSTGRRNSGCGSGLYCSTSIGPDASAACSRAAASEAASRDVGRVAARGEALAGQLPGQRVDVLAAAGEEGDVEALALEAAG
jgi:hypothetical protein